MDTIYSDFKHALRGLLKDPAYTLWIAAILALGIGANTAIFSLVNAVLIRPLPYPGSERLVSVTSTVQRDGEELRGISCPDFRDWREQGGVFEEMAAYYDTAFSLTGVGDAQRVEAELVTSGYWRVLGTGAALGRVFGADVDGELDAHAVAVVSDGFWRRWLGADRTAVGRVFSLNDRAFTVVGVTPPGFRGLDGDTDIWVPLSMLGTVVPKRYWDRRAARWLSAAASLKPGRTVEEADQQMKAVAAGLAATYPDSNAQYGAKVVSMRDAQFGDVRTSLLLLLGTVGFVLMIACANVANLSLTRASKKRRESAIRLALGASASRLVRLFLAESAWLVLLGLGLGGVVAMWCVEAIRRGGGLDLPDSVRVSMDSNVLLFNLAIGLACALVVGLIPAMKACRTDVNASLRDGGRTSSEGSATKRVRSILVISELTLALVLLVGAGLMVRTLASLQNIDVGFSPAGVASAVFELPASRYQPPQRLQFCDELLERLGALPGVAATAIGSDQPFGGSSSASIVSPEGADPPREADAPYGGGTRVYVHSVTPGFFETLQIPLLRGRNFGSVDTEQSGMTAILTSRAARRLWPEGDAVGKRFHFGAPGRSEPRWVTVAGIVGDTLQRELVLDSQTGFGDPDIYFPLSQTGRSRLTLLVRSGLEASAVTRLMRDEVQRLDPDLPLFDVATLEENLANQTTDVRFGLLLISSFAVMALLLAGLGVYGVISYSVRERSHEIGIRMALGASRMTVLRLVLRQGLGLAVVGLAMGLLAAAVLSRSMTSVLYEVSPLDTTTYLGAALVLLFLAVVATLVPALRATRVDPMEVMRYE